MENQLLIEEAGLDDISELAVLFDAYRVFYKKTSDLKAAKSFLTDRIKNKESVIFISRDNEGKATGFTQLYPLFSSTRMARFWLLNDLFVAREYRGQGYSKALIGEAKQLCVSTNAVGMMLETASDNHIGNQLYPRTGFILDKDHNYYTWLTEE